MLKIIKSLYRVLIYHFMQLRHIRTIKEKKIIFYANKNWLFQNINFVIHESYFRICKIKEKRSGSARTTHRMSHSFLLCESLTFGIESADESPRRRGEGDCIRPRLCALSKQIRRVHGRPSVYKAGVVHRVNNGRREKKTRAFGRQTRAVLKRRIAIYGADLFTLFAGTNAPTSRHRFRAENRFDARSIARRE